MLVDSCFDKSELWFFKSEKILKKGKLNVR